jgi:uncharacterized repeat protein (TIGR01451 family)
MSPAYASVCTDQTSETYWGWETRFNGSLAEGGTVKNVIYGDIGMKDLELELLEILSGEIANVRISNQGVFEEDFSVAETTNNFDITLEDIRVKVLGMNATHVNLTIYTHDQAIVTVVPTITYKSNGSGSSLPGEIVELELLVMNTGELEAENLLIVEEFIDFEIASKELTQPTAFCGGSTFTIEYELRPPSDLKEDTDYLLFIGFAYSYHNDQLDITTTGTKTLPIAILIKPTKVSVSKSTGNWTLLNQGREITVFNTVNNTGNTTAYKVNLVDTPPADLTVVSGQPSTSLGDLDPDEEKRRSYTVISNDPIFCFDSTKANFEDELGNSYTSFSDRVGIRFSPFVTIEKTIKDQPLAPELGYEWPIKTRRSMKSNYSNIEPASVNFTADVIMKTFDGVPYYSLCQGSFLNGTNAICIDNEGNEPKVLINRSVEVVVHLKNAGNTIARGISAYEKLKNIETSGDTSWSGSLMPGETTSYTYMAQPTGREIDITTDVSYNDVDPDSLESPEIEGQGVGICTKKLKNLSFNSSGNFSVTYPDLRIEQPSEINVYEDSAFDFLPILFNNGSEKIFDVKIAQSFGGLTLIKGQKLTALTELGRGFAPFRESTCNIAEWDNVNISRSIVHPHLRAGRSEVIYEIKDGGLRVYVNGVVITHSTECEEDGLEITHDVSVLQIYPFHVPPEPAADSTITEEEVTFKIYGNPYQNSLAFMTPSVENQTYIPLVTIVTYTDFYGNEYQRMFTTDIHVVPSTAAFAIVREERTDLALIINYTNETDLDEPGQLNFELENTGFASIEKYILNISLPQGVEIATNDSNWTGRVEAQIKRTNDTLFIFSGQISREGNISQNGKMVLPLTLRGQMSGSFEIPYRISYDGKEISGSLGLRVRGPVLTTTKELSKISANSGDAVTVTVKVENTGDGDAENVIVSDSVPGSIPVLSGDTQLKREVMKPGEEATFSYTISAKSSADMGGTKVSWQDTLGNTYIDDVEPVTLTVNQPTLPPTQTAPPEVTETPSPSVETPTPTAPPKGRLIPQEVIEERVELEISSREGIGVVALTLIVIVIVIRLITLKVPVKEEE